MGKLICWPPATGTEFKNGNILDFDYHQENRNSGFSHLEFNLSARAMDKEFRAYIEKIKAMGPKR